MFRRRSRCDAVGEDIGCGTSVHGGTGRGERLPR